MVSYQHENLIYYWDTILKLWAVYPEDLSKEADYYPRKSELKKYHPEFKFIKRIEKPTGFKAGETTEHRLSIN